MNASFEGVWPEEVPATLWNYELLKPDERWLLPFMGIRPDWGFVLWFLFGACVIVVFAHQRFRQRTFDPSSFDYRVLRELAPTQLTGRSPARRAYTYYAGTLIAIYFAMTFFGGLILRTVATIPMAGLQVKVDESTLHSTQWPLTLALAFAGFAPMIRPLAIVETWLRQRAHRWVGIPVKIKEHTRQLLLRLETMVSSTLSSEKARLPPWAAAHIEETDSVDRVIILHEELALLVRLSREEDVWPAESVREELRRLEVEQIAEAEIALQGFEEIITTDYSTIGAVVDRRAGVQADALKKHQRRLEAKLTVTTHNIDRLRNEFGSIFTVFAERDKNFEKIRDVDFRAVMKSTFPDDRTNAGPDLAVLLLLFPVFILYVAMIALGAHSLLTGVEKVALSIFVTALLETMRIAVIFWLPLLAVLLWQKHLESRGGWEQIRLPLSVQAATKVLEAMSLAAVVALIGLGLLALLWMAIISENPGRFRELLFGGTQPALPYFLGQAGAAPLFVLAVLCARDNLKIGTEKRVVLPIIFGSISAALVSSWMVAHLLYWSVDPCDSSSSFSFTCFRHYNATDFIVYGLMALLAPSVFTHPTLPIRKPGEQPAATVPLKLLISSVAVAAVALGCLGTSAAFAQTDPKSAAKGSDGKNVVVAGFRSDAEPFSYRLGPDDDRRFKGFIAELCYRIFEGSDYSVVSVAVDTNDRFDRLRKTPDDHPYDVNGAERDQKIDILCDPVTLRFSDPAGRADGIFSPIVFASGVSYLLRPTRASKSGAYLAYVANTTAALVAQRACEIDLLGVRDSEQEQNCTAPSDPNVNCPRGEMAKKRMYQFCVMENHSKLIEWFCQKEAPNYQLAYFGDREVILAKLAAWTEQQGCSTSEIEVEHPYFTYEPYALLVSKADSDLVQFVQRRIFEFFSHRSEAISLFTTYFPGVRMSPTVANLFLLNGVAEERFFTFSSPEVKSDTHH